MPAAKAYAGERFGKLTITHDVGYIGNFMAHVCLCDCGANTMARAPDLKSGKKKSCGCLRADVCLDRSTHGDAGRGKKTAEYRAWRAMKTRCTNRKQKCWPRYGGRGIKVCHRWNNSFANFLADMGRKPSPELTLERVNNDKGYRKSNCIWATYKEQANNRRAPSRKK